MTAEETHTFRLLDAYSRSSHGCFLAEMFPNAAGTRYTICFRASGENNDSANQYACRYLYVEADEVRTSGRLQELQTDMKELLDRELCQLSRR